MKPEKENLAQIDMGLKKDLDKMDETKYESLEKQIQAEYNISWDHQKDKKTEQLLRLRLYNNQKRDKSAVGDTTMFSTHQTVLAKLYLDRLTVEHTAREEGDEETVDNLNVMAENDYDDMEKDELDYDWDWDACAFGRGLTLFMEYIRDPDNKIYLPVPEILDPVTFLRDPRAVAVNGKGRFRRGAMRFGGREVRMTRSEMENHPHFFNNLDFTTIKFGDDNKSIYNEATEARSTAQGLSFTRMRMKEADLGFNAEYPLLEWYTTWKIDGVLKKVRAWLCNQRTKLVGLQVLSDLDVGWGIIDRPLYPHSHDWDGTSIWDLTEDKQRARAIAQNLGLNAMKSDLYPNYIYDSNKIRNRADLRRGFDKYIPVDGSTDGALNPVRKAAPNMQLLDFIYTSLDMSAQKATAVSDIQQGIQSQKDRPLGETNLLVALGDNRQGLASKVFGWSEKRFWRQWYYIYKTQLESGIDEKVLRLSGTLSPKFRPLMRENIIAKVDPDIRIESQVMSRSKQLEERQSTDSYSAILLNEPTANRRYVLKELGKNRGYKKDKIDRMLPPTVDERIAEQQNDLLNENKPVRVLPEDDHNVHLEIHARANPTKATIAHIQTHIKALSIKKVNPEFFPASENAEDFQAGTPDLNPVNLGGIRVPSPTNTQAA